MDRPAQKNKPHVVRLLQNRLYPTYQLCARMANKKTEPREGLRLAALVTMRWLALRLESAAPKEWADLPAPEQYKEAPDSCLCSLHISRGFLIDIVSLPDQGIWSLHITEPDLGPNPGTADQTRPAVPGRILETNVAFRITGQTLNCGFQTVVSDPEGTLQEAEVYRLAIIRQLANHPDFGLAQLTPLVPRALLISSADDLRDYLAMWKNPLNQLPCVLFSQPKAPARPAGLPENLLKINDLPVFGRAEWPGLGKVPTAPAPAALENTPAYDTDDFARHMQGFCRTYTIKETLLDKLSAQVRVAAEPGDILVMEPPCFGGQCHVVKFKLSAQRRKETVDSLRSQLSSYPKGKEVSFGPISFLSSAREELLDKTREAIRRAEDVSVEWQQRIAQLEARWNTELEKKELETDKLKQKIRNQEDHQQQLEAEKKVLQESHAQEIARLEDAAAKKDAQIAFLRRKLDQPGNLRGIAAWAEQYFSDRLCLLSCAQDMLKDKSLQADPELICDALDFLATDHWANRYERITKEEMQTRCSEKYGRPFEVKPIGEMTIKRYPKEYIVKYSFAGETRRRETPLDTHLCVGNDVEKLLRIYFFYDDARKLIVVGSLPRHLSTINR